jgi:hypothetical protein
MAIMTLLLLHQLFISNQSLQMCIRENKLEKTPSMLYIGMHRSLAGI